MLTSGVVILLGFVFLLIKLPRRTMLKLLGKPLLVDVIVSVAAYALHWGTFSGVMAAAVAGLLCSCVTWCSRKAVGYIENGRYVPGIWRLELR